MKTSIDKKVQIAEDKLATILYNSYDIDLNKQPERESRQFANLAHYTKDWLKNYLPDSSQLPEISELVKSYFDEEDNIFETRLAMEVSNSIQSKSITELKKHLNDISSAIAIEKVKRKLCKLVLDTSMNS